MVRCEEGYSSVYTALMSDDSDHDIEEDEMSEEEAMIELLGNLKEEHRRIDKEIKAAEETGVVDVLKIRRMKKIKLSIKDQVTFLENQLTPDIIA